MTPRERKFSPLAALIPAAILALTLAAAPAHASGGVGDLYVTSDASNVVRAYVGTTGALIGTQSVGVLGAGELGIILCDRVAHGEFAVLSEKQDAGAGELFADGANREETSAAPV